LTLIFEKFELVTKFETLKILVDKIIGVREVETAASKALQDACCVVKCLHVVTNGR
jgi:hypothetical protein